MEQLDFKTLKERQRALRDDFPQDLSLRVHRAISWGLRAEQERSNDSSGEEREYLDGNFVFLWIGFNAAFARNTDAAMDSQDTLARNEFMKYFRILKSCDEEGRIDNIIWERFSNEIRLLLKNPYVYSPFWKFHNGIPGYEDWETRLRSSWTPINHAIKNSDTPKFLSFLFDRLYVLRNQIMHGGATWNSSVNRDQVRDGVAIMGLLLPVFIDLMMENPDKDWGPPWYPVVDKEPQIQR